MNKTLNGQWSTTRKALLALCTFAFAGSPAVHAETYWLKAASNGQPPNCFTFCSDEACTITNKITPKANDGNTYVVLGSAKMAGKYTAPAGTTWIFGTDGSTVGTTKSRPSFNTNGSIILNFGGTGVCTIYGMKAQINSAGALTWAGTNRFVYTGQEITFSPVNVETSASRDLDLSGTYLGEKDVTVSLDRAKVTASETGKIGSTATFTLSGDFSAYKGAFSANNSTSLGYAIVKLTSPTAFGDPTATNSAYLTLKNWMTLEIDASVPQYASKGIQFNNTLTVCTNTLSAAEGAAWTLSAPVSCANAKGAVAKGGAGTISLAGSWAGGTLVVNEGTIVITKSATFAEGSKLVICPGGQVVSQVGLNVPNLTIVRAGGSFSFDFTAPFDGTTVTTLDMTTMTAEDWASLDKPIPVQLSQAIPLPLNASNRYAIAKFPKALNVTVDQFKDATPNTYGLPTKWIEVVSCEDCDRVDLVARPALQMTVTESDLGATPVLLPAQQKNATTEAVYNTWSDGLAAHAGADYFNTVNQSMFTAQDWQHAGSRFVFPGESLVLVSGFLCTKHETTVFKRLIEYDGVGNRAMGVDFLFRQQRMEGALEIPSGTVYFTGVSGSSFGSHFDLGMTVSGSAQIAFSGNSGGVPAQFSGDASAFAGTINTTMTGTFDQPALLSFTNITSLIADRTSYDPRAIRLAGDYNLLMPLTNTIFEGVNYGIAPNGYMSGFMVPTNVTLTLNGDVRFQGGNTAKFGPGILALGGKILYQYDGLVDPYWNVPSYGKFYLNVCDGWLMPYAWNGGASYRMMRIKICKASAGFAASLEPTDEHIATYGMFLRNEDAITLNGVSKMAVRLLKPTDESLLETPRTVPLLTVTNTLAEALSGKIDLKRDFHGVKASVISSASDVEGYTTISATLEPTGFVLIIR